MFKLWITIIILHLLLTVGVVFAEEHDVCKHEQKFSQIWYINGCDGEKLEVKKVKVVDKNKDNPWKGYPYNSGEIPRDADPNDKILKHYLKKYISYGKDDGSNYFKVKKDKNKIKEFNFNLQKNDFVIEQLNETALLSYLMYVDGQIVIDEISPKDRFGKIFTNKTRYVSNSVGKSITSYITGHAICRGYIDGIHSTLDWDVFNNTVYDNAKLIDVLNMSSGIQEYYVDENFKNSNRWPNKYSVQSIMKKELKNSVAGENKYFYANMDTNVVASYVVHKMGWKNYKKMLKEIFNDKVGIENHVVMHQQQKTKRSQHSLTYGMYFTRYDYMRVAVAMLNDWNNNTCEGQYLKDLYENKISKGDDYNVNNSSESMSDSKYYAGQFYVGMNGDERPIFIMSGFGGQNINIDFENNKIISIMSIHRNFDWMKLVNSNF
jgi:CubicO group peptidase (beta-lactamase class C family)